MKIERAFFLVLALVLVAFLVVATVLICRSFREAPIEVSEEVSEDDSLFSEPDVSEEPIVKSNSIVRHTLSLEERKKIMDRNFVFVYEELMAEPYQPVEEVVEVVEPEPVRYLLDYNPDFYKYDGYYKYGNLYKMPMPYHYQSMVYKYCEKYDVPYELALAVSGVETSFDAERGVVVGKNGHAYFGPGMVNKYYYEKRTGKTLSTPEDGIIAMVETLARKMEEFDGNVHHALMAYNYGSGYTRGKIADGQNESKYSNRVMEIYNGLLQYKKENS